MHRSIGGALAVALVLGAFSGAAAAQSAQKPGAKDPAAKSAPSAAPMPSAPAGDEAKPDTVKIDGFRSAAFGMNETQLRAAIRKDFNHSGDKIASEENANERTTVLSVTVDELLPDAGPARVSYILGHKSKRLIQVNIVWGAPGGQVAPEKLVAAANNLRQYFLGAGYQPDSIVANAKADDGTIVVFKGADAQKRMTLLRLISGAPSKDAEKSPAMLSLSYVQDAQNPDIFRISKGQF
jgi:hypothetical protein